MKKSPIRGARVARTPFLQKGPKNTPKQGSFFGKKQDFLKNVKIFMKFKNH